MSNQFFYVQLKFTPKIETNRVPMTKQQEAVVEVPKDLVERKQSESKNENLRESWRAKCISMITNSLSFANSEFTFSNKFAT